MKKFICAAIISAMMLCTLGTAFAAQTVPGAVYGDQNAAGLKKPVERIQSDLQKAGIKDVTSNDWYAGSITVMVENGLMAPDTSGQFNPNTEVSTTAGVAVFAKVLGIASKNDTPEQALKKAQEAGLVNTAVTAKPNAALSRLEVARMLATALGVKPSASSTNRFSDIAGLSNEDKAILNALYDLGVFKGFEDGTFRPDSTLTRAQIAILVDRLLGAKK